MKSTIAKIAKGLKIKKEAEKVYKDLSVSLQAKRDKPGRTLIVLHGMHPVWKITFTEFMGPVHVEPVIRMYST